MIENTPSYVSIVFILTTFFTIGTFLYAFKSEAFSSTPAKVLSFLIPFWVILQASLALTGFYLKIDALPPRLPLFAVLPAFLTVIFLIVFARRNFISRLPLKTLTILHVVRIPVEVVLFWLFQAGLVPQLMTFEGRNFDLLSGLTAPLIYWLAFRGSKTNRPLLIVWNILALGLLTNIVVNAFLSFPFAFQQFAFDQPNRAVLYFPFVWLPSVIVPIVLFCHLASLWQLASNDKIKPV